VAIYAIRRVLEAIPTLIVIAILSFFMMHLAPGGPFQALLRPGESPETVIRIEQSYGLFQPLPVQFWDWFTQIIQGNFGVSITYNTPVLAMIAGRLPVTLTLITPVLVLSFFISVGLGMLQALRQYSTVDHVLTFFSFAAAATPDFWLGLMLILVFSITLGWFPAGGMYTIGAPYSLLDHLKYLVLPVTTLTVISVAPLARFVRASMLEVAQLDYVRTAQAKGLPSRAITYRHIFRNALIPVITLLGLNFLPGLFGGALITETVFDYPGMGQLAFNAAIQRDYPLVMALTMIASALVVLGNLLADLGYAWLDPRVQYN
jgi:peptide/nickel transport system permease protein